MASIDDVVSNIKGAVVNIGQLIAALRLNESFYIVDTIQLGTLTTTSVQVIAADSTRNALLFHNPGDSISLLVAPATDSSGNAISLSLAARQGGYIVSPHDFVPLTGNNCQLAWNGISLSGSSNPLTIGIA